MLHTRVMLVAGLAVGSIGLSNTTALADRIRLRGGNEIKGVIVTDPAKPDVVLVQTENLATPLTFPKGGVTSVVREPSSLDEYVAQKAKLDETAQAHYDFGLWCEEAGLKGPAEAEFKKSVTIDPGFGPSHKKLGHVQHGDRWLTYDQQREAQGLVKHKGKWISKAEKDKIDGASALASQQSSWASRLKILRRKLQDTDTATREDAEAQITAIRDPAAIPGLIRLFWADGSAAHLRLAQIIGGIEGPDAAEAVVNMIISEPDSDVRQMMLNELTRRHDPDTPGRFIAVLKAKDPDIVGRAAWALAQIKHAPAVPKLIDALIQSEKRMMMMQVATPGGGSGGFSGSVGFAQSVGPGVGNIAPGIGNNSGIATGGISTSGSGIGSAGAAIGGDASKGFTSVASQGYVTGVAVGPGVVAYGASSVPVPIGVNPVMTDSAPRISEIPAKVKVNYQNQAVLLALESLTGENFGFDQPAWKKWLSTTFKIEPQAPRRVPKR